VILFDLIQNLSTYITNFGYFADCFDFDPNPAGSGPGCYFDNLCFKFEEHWKSKISA